MDGELTKLRTILPTINGQNTLLFFRKREQQIKDDLDLESLKKPKILNPIEEKIDNLVQKCSNISHILSSITTERRDKLEVDTGYANKKPSTAFRAKILRNSSSSKIIIHSRPMTTKAATSNFFFSKKKKNINPLYSPQISSNKFDQTVINNNIPGVGFITPEVQIIENFSLSGQPLKLQMLENESLPSLQRIYLRNMQSQPNFLKAETEPFQNINDSFKKKNPSNNLHMPKIRPKFQNSNIISSVDSLVISPKKLINNNNNPDASPKPLHHNKFFPSPSLPPKNGFSTLIVDGSYLFQVGHTGQDSQASRGTNRPHLKSRSAKNLIHEGDYNQNQLEILKTFKEEVCATTYDNNDTNIPYNDAYLLRFLNARRFDLKETLLMWKKFCEWRKINDIDNIKAFFYSEIDEVLQCYPHGFFRNDKQGRPIYIQRLGALKLHQLFKCTTEDRLIKHFAQTYERLLHEILPACSKHSGHNVDQIIVILDLKGAQTKVVSKQIYDFIQRLTNVTQDNYPELLARMFIVNAPLLFSGIWAIIKPNLDERTRSKISILGTQFETQLLEQIDEENLPDFLGGKCTVQDYGICMNKEQGNWMIDNGTKRVLTENISSDDEDEKERENLSNLKSMLAGMKFPVKSSYTKTKKITDNDDNNTEKSLNLKIFVPDTPINTQLGEEDDNQKV